MDPNQTAPKHSDLGPYCLQYSLHMQMKEHMTAVLNGGKGANA